MKNTTWWVVCLLAGVPIASAQTEDEPRPDPERRPSLYTEDFGDCLDGSLGDSLFNVTRFDAAYYADNQTVVFHLDAVTSIRRQDVMLHLVFDAYGETRYNRTYDPCEEDMDTLCPLDWGTTIEVSGVFPIDADADADADFTDLPSITLDIPDVEGSARLHILASSTGSQVGCFQAVLTNGHSFSQRRSVGVVLAGCTLLAMAASLATAVYGVSLPHMRTHYAHSLSALVVWETWQSIFLSGALSVRWPSLLPAWWSNYAFAAGMVASDALVQAVGGFTGTDAGRTSQVGGDGLPLPGTWPGFGGTLSSVGIPPADAFIVALIWFVAALVGVAVLVTLVKVVLDVLVRLGVVRSDGFDYFRHHWLGYTAAALLRTLFVGFFVMVTLSLYQLSLRGRAGPTALAAVVLVVLAVGLGSIAAYACFVRLRRGRYAAGPDTLRIEQGTLFRTIPFVAVTRESRRRQGGGEEKMTPRRFGSLPFVRIRYIDNDPDRVTVHLDDAYVRRFGWLAGRYRRTRWWFFAVYLFYQFVRGCFLGGASRDPPVQVYGLLVWEVLALVVVARLRPFEGQRNTVAAVWMLSLSKIVTHGLAVAFLPEHDLGRVPATVLGLIIVIVQGFVTLAVIVLIVVGLVSTCMSLSRNTERFPSVLEDTRVAYFEHIEHRANDVPGPRPPLPDNDAEMVTQRTFSVREVRREPKIEDENKDDDDLDAFPDLEPVAELDEGEGEGGDGGRAEGQNFGMGSVRRSRANSAASRYSSTTLPRAARVHRASWSSRDFSQWDADATRHETRRVGHRRSNSLRMQALAAQGGITSVEDLEAPRRTMTPAEGLSLNTNVPVRSHAMIEEVDDEERKGEPYDVSPLTPSEKAFDEQGFEEKSSKDEVSERDVATSGPPKE